MPDTAENIIFILEDGGFNMWNLVRTLTKIFNIENVNNICLEVGRLNAAADGYAVTATLKQNNNSSNNNNHPDEKYIIKFVTNYEHALEYLRENHQYIRMAILDYMIPSYRGENSELARTHKLACHNKSMEQFNELQLACNGGAVLKYLRDDLKANFPVICNTKPVTGMPNDFDNFHDYYDVNLLHKNGQDDTQDSRDDELVECLDEFVKTGALRRKFLIVEDNGIHCSALLLTLAKIFRISNLDTEVQNLKQFISINSVYNEFRKNGHCVKAELKKNSANKYAAGQYDIMFVPSYEQASEYLALHKSQVVLTILDYGIEAYKEPDSKLAKQDQTNQVAARERDGGALLRLIRTELALKNLTVICNSQSPFPPLENDQHTFSLQQKNGRDFFDNDMELLNLLKNLGLVFPEIVEITPTNSLKAKDNDKNEKGNALISPLESNQVKLSHSASTNSIFSFFHPSSFPGISTLKNFAAGIAKRITPTFSRSSTPPITALEQNLLNQSAQEPAPKKQKTTNQLSIKEEQKVGGQQSDKLEAVKSQTESNETINLP